MVDGRTVGEVIPNSASAKEICDLWVYIRDRLARHVQDPTLSPENRPDHFSVGSLSAVVDEPEMAEPPPPVPLAVKGGQPSSGTYQPYQPPKSFETPKPFEVPKSFEPPKPFEAPKPSGIERNFVKERKDIARSTLFGGVERRPNTFGRRGSD
jgi:hypothetical protein